MIIDRRSFVLFVLASARSVCPRLLGASDATDSNLVSNAGFEIDSAGVPTDWSLDDSVKTRGTFHLDKVTFYRGKQSLRLTPNGANVHPDRPYSWAQIVSATALAGKNATFSAALRAQGGAQGGCMALILDQSGRMIGSALLSAPEANTFAAESKTFAVPSGAQKVILACYVSSTQGSVWFDDVFLGVAGATKNSAAGSGGALSAEIAIHAEQGIRHVPPLLFGTNLEWIRDADGLWNTNQSRLNQRITQAAKNLPVTAVRFPGGTLADYYHWRDGIGPQSKRPVKPHVQDDGSSPNVFGTHEVMQFCSAINAQPILMANPVTGTPEEAAAWVDYCNSQRNPERARNGSPSPFSVRLWEIGNEPYLVPGYSGTRKSSMSVQEYCRRYDRYAHAMLAADPSIRLGAETSLNFGRYRLSSDGNWNRTLLESAKAPIDFLSVHNGYAPIVIEDAGVGFEDVYRAMLAFPVQFKRSVDQLSDDINRCRPGSAARVEIGITEWGPLFQVSPNSRWIGHTKTLGSALYVASLVQMMLKCDRVTLACFLKLTDNGFSGWIMPNGEPKPIYYALQMFEKNFGTEIVSCKVTSATYSSPALGLVEAENEVPLLDVIASISSDKQKLYINVVNKHFNRALKAHINVSGFTPGARAKTVVLTAPALDANNGEDLPRIPGLTWARQAHATSNSMYDKGAPGSVRPQEALFEGAGRQFAYTFPPISVTALELQHSDRS